MLSLRSRRYLQTIGITTLVSELLLMLVFVGPAVSADDPKEAVAILLFGAGVTFFLTWWSIRSRLSVRVDVDPGRELITVFYFRRVSTIMSFDELARARLVTSRLGNVYLHVPGEMTPGRPLPALAAPFQRRSTQFESQLDSKIPEPLRSIPFPVVVSTAGQPESSLSVPLLIGATALARGTMPRW